MLRLHNHGLRPVRAVRVAVSHPTFFILDRSGRPLAATGSGPEAGRDEGLAASWITQEAGSGGGVEHCWEGGVTVDVGKVGESGDGDGGGDGFVLWEPIAPGGIRDVGLLCCAATEGRHCLRVLVHYHGDGDETLLYPEPAVDMSQRGTAAPARPAKVRVGEIGRLVAACHSLLVVPAVTVSLHLRPRPCIVGWDAGKQPAPYSAGQAQPWPCQQGIQQPLGPERSIPPARGDTSGSRSGSDVCSIAWTGPPDAAAGPTLVLSIDGRQAPASCCGAGGSLRVASVMCCSAVWRIAAAVCPGSECLAVAGRRVTLVLSLARVGETRGGGVAGSADVQGSEAGAARDGDGSMAGWARGEGASGGAVWQESLRGGDKGASKHDGESGADEGGSGNRRRGDRDRDREIGSDGGGCRGLGLVGEDAASDKIVSWVRWEMIGEDTGGVCGVMALSNAVEEVCGSGGAKIGRRAVSVGVGGGGWRRGRWDGGVSREATQEAGSLLGERAFQAAGGGGDDDGHRAMGDGVPASGAGRGDEEKLVVVWVRRQNGNKDDACAGVDEMRADGAGGSDGGGCRDSGEGDGQHGGGGGSGGGGSGREAVEEGVVEVALPAGGLGGPWAGSVGSATARLRSGYKPDVSEFVGLGGGADIGERRSGGSVEASREGRRLGVAGREGGVQAGEKEAGWLREGGNGVEVELVTDEAARAGAEEASRGGGAERAGAEESVCAGRSRGGGRGLRSVRAKSGGEDEVASVGMHVHVRNLRSEDVDVKAVWGDSDPGPDASDAASRDAHARRTAGAGAGGVGGGVDSDGAESWQGCGYVCCWAGAVGGWVRVPAGSASRLRVTLKAGPGRGVFGMPALGLAVQGRGYGGAAGAGGGGRVEHVWVCDPAAPRLLHLL